MEEFIKNYLKKHNLKYYRITNPSSLEQIYNLYYHGPNENDYHSIDDMIDLYFGIYYNIHKKYDLMKKYYLMAIDKGNCVAMHKLGLHYDKVEKDYDQMKNTTLWQLKEIIVKQ